MHTNCPLICVILLWTTSCSSRQDYTAIQQSKKRTEQLKDENTILASRVAEAVLQLKNTPRTSPKDYAQLQKERDILLGKSQVSEENAQEMELRLRTLQQTSAKFLTVK